MPTITIKQKMPPLLDFAENKATQMKVQLNMDFKTICKTKTKDLNGEHRFGVSTEIYSKGCIWEFKTSTSLKEKNRSVRMCLQCRPQKFNRNWLISGRIKFSIDEEVDGKALTVQGKFTFDDSNKYIVLCFPLDDIRRHRKRAKNDGTMRSYFTVSLIEIKGIIIRTDFPWSDSKTDVELVCGRKKVRANKQFLAMHSTYFEELFFGKDVDRNQSQFSLEGVSYGRMLAILLILHSAEYGENVPQCQLGEYTFGIKRVADIIEDKLCANYKKAYKRNSRKFAVMPILKGFQLYGFYDDTNSEVYEINNEENNCTSSLTGGSSSSTEGTSSSSEGTSSSSEGTSSSSEGTSSSTEGTSSSIDYV